MNLFFINHSITENQQFLIVDSNWSLLAENQ